MTKSVNGDLRIFSGNANLPLAQKICEHLGMELGKLRVERFADGEVDVQLLESVRAHDCYLIQPTCPPVNENLMELLIMIDTFKRASAGKITAVIPYFGYARQDRKAKSRDPISAKLCANLIATAGADRLLTMDLHAPQIQGFFDIPVDHLLGVPVIAPYFQDKFKNNRQDVVVVSPDLGSVTRARNLAERLDVALAIVDKRRPKANVSEVMNIIGDVRGKCVLIADDMIDTAGTLCNGAKSIVEVGGAKEVYACATHGVLSGPAIDRIQGSVIKELVILDTIPLPENKRIDKIKTLSVASIFAEAIQRIYEDKSIALLFR